MSTIKQEIKNQHHAYILFYLVLTVAFILICFHFFKISIEQNLAVILHGLVIGIMIFTLAVLYHATEQRSAKGKENTKVYFEFPVALFAIIFTLGNIVNARSHINIISTMFLNHKNLTFNDYNNHIIVDRWEDESMKKPELNTFYLNTFELQSTPNSPFMSEEEWQKKYPHIAYITFKGNELQWHYAAKFIQQMIGFSRLFSLEQKFPIDKKRSVSDHFFNEYAGWITNFRMFLKNDVVRNVWEQTSKFYATPSFIEWVKFHITDIIDNDPNFFKEHKEKWDEATEIVIKETLEDNKNKTIIQQIMSYVG
jgi:hypothetical protein